MNLAEQAEITAEAFASRFLDDTFGYDIFLGSQIERIVAENAHIIYRSILDPKFFGAAVTHQSGEEFVVLNTSQPLRIRYFTAAHELWHLSDASKIQHEDFNHERAADRFAACIMLPKPLLTSLWRKFKKHWNEEQAILFISDLASAPYKTVERRIEEIGEQIKITHTEESWVKLREKYHLPFSPLDYPVHDIRFTAYERQVLQHVAKGLDPLTASNKLAIFSSAMSEELRQEGLDYEVT